AALPNRCIHRLICTPKSAIPTSIWVSPTTNGITAARPMTADINVTGPHHEYCLNTAQAAIVNPTTAVMARMFTKVHAVPVGGGVRSAKAGVIHRNVDPNRNSPTAARFLNVHITVLLTC